MSIIDFRVRPPYKSFLNTGIVKRWQNATTDPYKQLGVATGRRAVPSLDQGNMDMLIEEMDRSDVSKIVVWGRRSTAVGAVGFSDVPNDEVAELRDKYAGRIIPIAGIDPHEKGAAKEIERTVKEMGFAGAAIDSPAANPPMYVDDESLDELYAVLEQSGGILCLSLSVIFGPDISYSDPLRVNRLARKFPNLNIVISHACWPFVDAMIGVAMSCPNVYLVPDCYMYVTDMPGADRMIQATRFLLPHKVLFGSAYPVRGVEQCVDLWKNMPFSPQTMRATLYDNAAKLLKID